MTTLSPFRRKVRNDARKDILEPFADFFNDNFFSPILSNIHSFRTDIKDSEKAYIIEAELPGFEKEDIMVEYSNHYLTITAKKEADMKLEKEDYIRQERHYGDFFRRFYVADIDENAIEASFKNGVLTLNCPKLVLEKPEQKRIEIH